MVVIYLFSTRRPAGATGHHFLSTASVFYRGWHLFQSCDLLWAPPTRAASPPKETSTALLHAQSGSDSEHKRCFSCISVYTTNSDVHVSPSSMWVLNQTGYRLVFLCVLFVNPYTKVVAPRVPRVPWVLRWVSFSSFTHFRELIEKDFQTRNPENKQIPAGNLKMCHYVFQPFFAADLLLFFFSFSVLCVCFQVSHIM